MAYNLFFDSYKINQHNIKSDTYKYDYPFNYYIGTEAYKKNYLRCELTLSTKTSFVDSDKIFNYNIAFNCRTSGISHDGGSHVFCLKFGTSSLPDKNGYDLAYTPDLEEDSKFKNRWNTEGVFYYYGDVIRTKFNEAKNNFGYEDFVRKYGALDSNYVILLYGYGMNMGGVCINGVSKSGWKDNYESIPEIGYDTEDFHNNLVEKFVLRGDISTAFQGYTNKKNNILDIIDNKYLDLWCMDHQYNSPYQHNVIIGSCPIFKPLTAMGFTDYTDSCSECNVGISNSYYTDIELDCHNIEINSVNFKNNTFLKSLKLNIGNPSNIFKYSAMVDGCSKLTSVVLDFWEPQTIKKSDNLTNQWKDDAEKQKFTALRDRLKKSKNYYYGSEDVNDPEYHRNYMYFSDNYSIATRPSSDNYYNTNKWLKIYIKGLKKYTKPLGDGSGQPEPEGPEDIVNQILYYLQCSNYSNRWVDNTSRSAMVYDSNNSHIGFVDTLEARMIAQYRGTAVTQVYYKPGKGWYERTVEYKTNGSYTYSDWVLSNK